MTKYQFLLSRSSTPNGWTSIHLEHSGLNYIQFSNDKKCGTATISRALSFMNQEVM